MSCPFKYKEKKPKDDKYLSLLDTEHWVDYNACKIMNDTVCVGESKCPIMKK